MAIDAQEMAELGPIVEGKRTRRPTAPRLINQMLDSNRAMFLEDVPASEMQAALEEDADEGEEDSDDADSDDEDFDPDKEEESPPPSPKKKPRARK